MSSYTPTTEEVRQAIDEWMWSRRMHRPELVHADGKEVDRWLTAETTEAKAEAWDEGALAAWDRSTPEVNGARYHWRSDGAPASPYRTKGIEAQS